MSALSVNIQVIQYIYIFLVAVRSDCAGGQLLLEAVAVARG